jgi:hypothetical protein
MTADDPDETAGRKLYRDRADASLRALDAIARRVLSYHPKPKSKPAKARKRRAAKIAKGKADA